MRPWRVAVVFLLACWAFMRWGYGAFAGWLAAPDWFQVKQGLPSTGVEFELLPGIALCGILCYLTYDEERWRNFKRPLFDFLGRSDALRNLVLFSLPVLVGVWTLSGALAAKSEPLANPLRHPTPPEAFSRMENPFRKPTAQMLQAFQQRVAAGAYDAEKTSEPKLAEYIKAVKAGAAGDDLRLVAFERACTEEGRNLYQTNCQACHSCNVTGTGPLAAAQRRAPAEFTGVETIATLVEGAVFWRVKTGGIGMPPEGAPWETTMPRWEADLSDDEIWKIIMALYELAGNKPREPESHHP